MKRLFVKNMIYIYIYIYILFQDNEKSLCQQTGPVLATELINHAKHGRDIYVYNFWVLIVNDFIIL